MKDFLAVVQEAYQGFVPRESSNGVSLYTFRYTFALKVNDEVVHRFQHLTGPWSAQLAFYEKLCNDDSIERCVAEYLGEFDASFAGVVIYIKKEEEK